MEILLTHLLISEASENWQIAIDGILPRVQIGQLNGRICLHGVLD